MYGLRDDSIAKIRGLFDFTRCERADGSAYGTAGKCRLGVEAEKTEIKAVSLTSQQMAEGDKIIKDASEMFKLDKEKTAEFFKEVAEEKKKVLQEMNDQLITRGEIDSFIKNHPGKGDFMTARVITVGMEETLPSNPSPKQIDEGMAVKLAQERVRKRLGLDHMPKELVVAGEIQTPGEPLHEIARGETKVPGAAFWQNKVKLLSQAGAKDAEDGRSYKLYASKNHAGLELGAIPAASVSEWPVGTRPWVKNVSSVNDAIGNRRRTARLYGADRSRALLSQIDKAIANNPNLTTISVAPGKNKGVGLTNLIFSHLQEKGAQIYERDVPYNRANETARVRLAIIRGAGGHKVTVVDPGVSVSNSNTNSFYDGIGNLVREAKSGVIQPTGFTPQPTKKERKAGKGRQANEKRAPRQKTSPAAPTTAPPKKLVDPLFGNRVLLSNLRARGLSDAQIKRDYPTLHKMWNQIQ